MLQVNSLLETIAVLLEVLKSSDASHSHRINCFQVRRVRENALVIENTNKTN